MSTVLLAACAGPADPTTPEANRTMTQQPSQHSGAAATPDAARFGAAPPVPEVGEASTETDDGVRVIDLTFTDVEAGPTEAYLVLPADSGSRGPGILWFHWLEAGSPTSNRTEFLDEARAMARRGAVSLLVQGTLPWRERPSSIDHDVAAIEREVRMTRAALELLASRPEVDPERLAAVGHDFGGMYLSILFGLDGRLDALAVMAPTARWGDWFLSYWPISDSADAYSAATAALDPVTWLAAGRGRPILLQFASEDEYVPADVAAEITAAAGPDAESATFETGHEMSPEARDARDAWLADRLGLGS
jgi:predicted esterase